MVIEVAADMVVAVVAMVGIAASVITVITAVYTTEGFTEAGTKSNP
jgi:hypothetical protein